MDEDKQRNALAGPDDSQAWGGLRSYLPEQPEWMKYAQQTFGNALGSIPPEVALMLNFLARSQVGAAIGRDHVMARRLEHKARTTDGTYDKGITGGQPEGIRAGSSYFYDPIARSSTGLMLEPGMTWSAAIPDQFRLPMTDASRLAPPANSLSRFDVIPGGKK